MEIFDRIKFLRKDILKKTQQEFSESIHISRSNMGNIEIGRIAVTDRVINDICEAFNVSENWLRTGEGEMFVQMSRDEEIAAFMGDVLSGESDNFRRRFIAMLSKLNEDQWELLEQMVDEMAKEIKKD